jgi:hypothetical protein
VFEGVSHVDLKMLNQETGSVAFAYVSFCSVEEAQRAYDQLQADKAVTLPCGAVCHVSWAVRNSRLHVANLDSTTTTASLVELFSKVPPICFPTPFVPPLTHRPFFAQYGRLSDTDPVIVSKRMSSNPLYQQLVCFAVIHFAARYNQPPVNYIFCPPRSPFFCLFAAPFDVRRMDAEAAKNGLNGTFVQNRRIRVEWHRNKAAGASAASTATSPAASVASSPTAHFSYAHAHAHAHAYAYAHGLHQPAHAYPSPDLALTLNPSVLSIYVTFECPADLATTVDEAMLCEVFAPYGHVSGAYMKSSAEIAGNRVQGYGYASRVCALSTSSTTRFLTPSPAPHVSGSSTLTTPRRAAAAPSAPCTSARTARAFSAASPSGAPAHILRAPPWISHH